jgi:hypothetical protein
MSKQLEDNYQCPLFQLPIHSLLFRLCLEWHLPPEFYGACVNLAQTLMEKHNAFRWSSFSKVVQQSKSTLSWNPFSGGFRGSSQDPELTLMMIGEIILTSGLVQLECFPRPSAWVKAMQFIQQARSGQIQHGPKSPVEDRKPVPATDQLDFSELDGIADDRVPLNYPGLFKWAETQPEQFASFARTALPCFQKVPSKWNDAHAELDQILSMVNSYIPRSVPDKPVLQPLSLLVPRIYRSPSLLQFVQTMVYPTTGDDVDEMKESGLDWSPLLHNVRPIVLHTARCSGLDLDLVYRYWNPIVSDIIGECIYEDTSGGPQVQVK